MVGLFKVINAAAAMAEEPLCLTHTAAKVKTCCTSTATRLDVVTAVYTGALLLSGLAVSMSVVSL